MDLQQLLKRKYSTQICHYRRGGNLTIFDKDDDTVERKQLEVLTAKHGRSLRLLCTVGGDQAKLNGVQKSQLVLEAGREQSCRLLTFFNSLSLNSGVSLISLTTILFRLFLVLI